MPYGLRVLEMHSRHSSGFISRFSGLIGRRPLAFLIIYSLLFRLLFMLTVPFVADESLYAVMIEEQIDSPSLNPTFLGYEVGWKPPLFFWVYAPFAALLKPLPIPLEAVYRLPTVLFGMLNVVLAYHIISRLSGNKEIIFYTTLVYSTIFLGVNTDAKVLTDTLAMTFILASILAYLRAGRDNKQYILAGIFAFLAFFVKQALAFMAPLVATFYFLQFDRKTLTNSYFIISLLLPVLAVLVNYSIFENKGQADTVYLDMIENKILKNFDLEKLSGSLMLFFILTSVWLPLSMLGFLKHWRDNLALSCWYALTIFPLIAAYGMPYYFLPVMLPMAYFSVSALIHNEKSEVTTDRFFKLVLAMLIPISTVIGFIFLQDVAPTYQSDKEAGELLVGKENVMMVGYYHSGIFGYKMLNEERATGGSLDFGWILITDEDIPEDTALSYVRNYNANAANITQGSFSKIFFEGGTYRKDTNITEFRYFVFTNVYPAVSEHLPFNNTLLYYSSEIAVFGKS